MIKAFILCNGNLKKKNILNVNDFDNITPIWIDLINPSIEEKQWIKKIFNIKIFLKKKKKNIFYIKNLKKNYIYFYNNFLFEIKKKKFLTTLVTFILYKKILFTIRTYNLPIFSLIKNNIKNNIYNYIDCKDILLNLYKYHVEYFIDIIKLIYKKLELIDFNILKKIFNDYDAKYVFDIIFYIENLSNKIYNNIIDIKYIINLLMKNNLLNLKQQIIFNEILFNIKIISQHISFLLEKKNFLMDTVINFININQNKVVKFLTIISVFFLPSTLVASIYGMNFKFIPGINWFFGYYFSVFLMIFTTLILIIYLYKYKYLE
ncbi:CorA family divalent cation transporter [Candidatus Zinderia endosymbiont of Aphrophora alni]|uniref:CorA family divalent cation transporter n=1 Tax=Candidatus Zinderia endosymbiont of Aphrophora alni TaxID=3077951 RepID=UPI0030D5FB8A